MAKEQAYQHLASIEIEVELQNEDSLYASIPTDESVCRVYIEAIINRINRFEWEPPAKDYEYFRECYMLPILAVNIMTTPPIFYSAPSPEIIARLSEFLATLWKDKKLGYDTARVSGARPKEALLSEIFLCDKREFFRKDLEKIMESSDQDYTSSIEEIIEQTTINADTATKFYCHLLGKIDWQRKKQDRDLSYDQKMSGSDLLFRDVFPDKTSTRFLEDMDRQREVDQVKAIVGKLPPREKAAVEEWCQSGTSSSDTNRRAKNRALKKIRAKMPYNPLAD